MRSAETVLGIIHDRGSRESTAASEDTGEPGAPKGARPVRGGADGKVLTEQLASRLLHIVVGFEHEADARRFRDAMRARLEEFALTLHPDKTRLIAFGRFAAD